MITQSLSFFSACIMFVLFLHATLIRYHTSFLSTPSLLLEVVHRRHNKIEPLCVDDMVILGHVAVAMAEDMSIPSLNQNEDLHY